MSFARRLVPFANRLKPAESLSEVAALRQSRRGYADHAGEAKVNAWQAPTQIAKWKEEHIVIGVLSTWAVVIYGSLKIFGGPKPVAEGQGDSPAPAPAPAPAH